MTITKIKSDVWGALASAICLVHCIATPFIFVSAASLGHEHHHSDSPFWWSFVDIIFLVISLAAVYWSAKSTPKIWMKYTLYICWLLLAGFILNEKLGGLYLPEYIIYFPAFGLIILHLYNRKHDNCIDDECGV